MDKRIPVTILTGFLGAGKTTLLNRLMQQSGFGDTAVVINEFGQVDVDGGLVEEIGDRAFATSTGCICCTASGDVRLTLLGLVEAAQKGTGPAFSRVVIETTGLADPAPVMQTFMTHDIMLDRFVLNGVVTVVDAAQGLDTLQHYGEARRQLAVADLVVISKTDIPHEGDIAAELAARAPNALIVSAHELTAQQMFAIAAQDGAAPRPLQWLRFQEDGKHHRHDVSAFCFMSEQPIESCVMEMAISAMQHSFGRDLLRLKGIVALKDHGDAPMVVHAVQHIVSPPRILPGWPQGMQGSRLVAIVAGEGRHQFPVMMASFLPEMVQVGKGWG